MTFSFIAALSKPSCHSLWLFGREQIGNNKSCKVYILLQVYHYGKFWTEKDFAMYFWIIDSYCLFYSRLNFTSSSWRIIDLVSPKLFIFRRLQQKTLKMKWRLSFIWTVTLTGTSSRLKEMDKESLTSK